jgi:hypothetical protein
MRNRWVFATLKAMRSFTHSGARLIKVPAGTCHDKAAIRTDVSATPRSVMRSFGMA